MAQHMDEYDQCVIDLVRGLVLYATFARGLCDHQVVSVALDIGQPLHCATVPKPAMMKKLKGRPLASVMACNFVFMPPLVLPIRRPRSPFLPQGWKPCGGP